MKQRLILFLAVVVISCGFVLLLISPLKSEGIFGGRTSIIPANFENLPAVKPGPSEIAKSDNFCEPALSGDSAIVVFYDTINNYHQVLFEKDADKILPIASLTKLMTAAVVLNDYPLEKIIKISRKPAGLSDNGAGIKIGDEFTIKDFLYPLLIESDNISAYALADNIGIDNFTEKMNILAKKIGIDSSVFYDPAGLDPDTLLLNVNKSSARDLYRLTAYLKDKPLIWEILSTPRISLYSPGNIFHHEVVSTDEFLEKRPVLWRDAIIGGKTGWTPMAKGCLMIAIKSPNGKGEITAVILGSDDRFKDMENLIDWSLANYNWQ